MSKKRQNESSSIGIIGGADGPTAVYNADIELETTARRQWQTVLDACKIQAVPRERSVTGEETKTYLIDTYGAVEIEPNPVQILMLKVNVLSNFYPDALHQPSMPDKDADRETWLEWAQQMHNASLDAAKQIPDETYGLKYTFLRILHTETTESYYLACRNERRKSEDKRRAFFPKRFKPQAASLNEEEPEILLEIELSTGYMTMQNGCSMLMNEIILWQGVTKKDIEKCTPRFIAFTAAMWDTGKLDLG